MLVVSFSAAASRRKPQRPQPPARIPTPTSGSSIRGSSSVRNEHRDLLRRQDGLRPGHRRQAFRQMMSDELDIAYNQTACVMGSTDITVDQGGSGGSTAVERDAWPMRRVAAEARRVLLEMGSSRLGVPIDQLAVNAGVITVKADPAKRVTYGQLVGGKRFNVTLTGANINVTTGVAKVKPVQELKVVGLGLTQALRHPCQG